MSTSVVPPPNTSISLITTNTHSFTTQRRPFTYPSHFSLRRPTTFLRRLPSASHLSWLSPADPNDFRGWLLPDHPPLSNKPSGFPTILVAGIGTSLAILLAAVAHFSLPRKGFRLPISSSSSSLSVPATFEAEETNTTDFDAANSELETIEVESPDVVSESVTPETHQRRVITAVVDSSQQEAVHVLKKLKIIDEDAKADELCSRRDYARWLVRASSLLERNPKYKISTAITLAGSFVPVYEDVPFGDQDFDFIQALAEAGVVSSKLSSKQNLDGYINFFPERFISRRDLIDWRAQLEYDFAIARNQEGDKLR